MSIGRQLGLGNHSLQSTIKSRQHYFNILKPLLQEKRDYMTFFKALNPTQILILMSLHVCKKIQSTSYLAKNLNVGGNALISYVALFWDLGIVNKEKVGRRRVISLTEKGQMLIEYYINHLKK